MIAQERRARPVAELAALPDHTGLRYQEAANLLGCSYSEIKLLVKRRQLIYSCIGSRKRIPIFALRDYVQRRIVRAQTQT